MEQEYTTEIFGRNILSKDKFGGWKFFGLAKIVAGNIDDAINLTEKKARSDFKNSTLYVDRVILDKKIIYDTCWDGLGPLTSYSV